MNKHLNGTDVEQVQTLLLLLGIAAETGELDDQQVINASIAISLFISDRAAHNAKSDEQAQAAAVSQ